jgi:hypothetical protein
MISKNRNRVFTFLVAAGAIIFFLAGSTGCGIYKFNQTSIPDSLHTIHVNTFDNHARYVNPQIAQKLTERLKQKINSQTKLSQTNNDNPDLEINGFVSDYSFSTSAISGQQVASNRLTVSMHISLRYKDDTVEEHDVSRSFEFKGDQSFQQAEAALGEDIVRSLTDEIFNQLFSKW